MDQSWLLHTLNLFYRFKHHSHKFDHTQRKMWTRKSFTSSGGNDSLIGAGGHSARATAGTGIDDRPIEAG